MFGAETILMERCADNNLLHSTIDLINDFKEYFLSHGEPVGENLAWQQGRRYSTLEEKALGCTLKSGKSAVKGCARYGDRVTINGLNLLSAPWQRPLWLLPHWPQPAVDGVVHHRARHPLRHLLCPQPRFRPNSTLCRPRKPD